MFDFPGRRQDTIEERENIRAPDRHAAADRKAAMSLLRCTNSQGRPVTPSDKYDVRWRQRLQLTSPTFGGASGCS
jgi:hypothetical protein